MTLVAEGAETVAVVQLASSNISPAKRIARRMRSVVSSPVVYHRDEAPEYPIALLVMHLPVAWYHAGATIWIKALWRVTVTGDAGTVKHFTRMVDECSCMR